MRRYRPEPVLLLLIGAQWLATLAVVSLSHHDGWIFGDPEEARRVLAAADAVVHGNLPPGEGGLGWPLLLAPLVAVTGVKPEDALPVIVVFNVVVLAPLAAWAVLEIGRRIAGSLFGAIAAAIWITLPLWTLPLFNPPYRPVAKEFFAPVAAGLTLSPDWATAVGLSLATALALRALPERRFGTALAGTVAAFSATISALALGLVLTLGLAYVVSARARLAGAFMLGALPGLAALGIWRHRELGGLAISLGPISWQAFNGSRGTMAGLREHFFSNRLFQLVPIAGAIGTARLALLPALVLAGWVGSYALTTWASGSDAVDFAQAGFFREILPSLPATAALAAGIVALVPTLVDRYSTRFVAPEPPADVGRVLAGVALALLGVAPLLFVLVASV